MPRPRLLAVTVSLVVLGACSSTSSRSAGTDSSFAVSSTVSSTVPSTETGSATTTAAPTPITTAAPTTTPIATTAPTTRPTTAPSAPPTVAPTAPPASGPRIETFSMSTPTACTPPPGPDVSFMPPPTNPPVVKISWSATGADSVYVAIDNRDGPYYQDLPLVGSTDLNFNCPGPHTFWVVAVKGGSKDYKSQTFG